MISLDARKTDAVIVGGGPAGLAAALALRQHGIDCLVVDALRPPIEKGCGEGLMPNTRRALECLGVSIGEEEGYPFRGIRFIDGRSRVEADFPDGVGVGVRRTHLHARMHDQALAAGARFAWGRYAKLEANGSVSVDGATVSAKWVIGADGTASRVRSWAGLDGVRHRSERVGYRRHYRVAPWSEHVEVYWGPKGQVYVTPVARDQICLIYISRHGDIDRAGFLDDLPQVRKRLGGAEMITPQRGALSATRRLRRVAHGRVALLGDASGSVDAITGEGLAMTFLQAAALASSLARGGVEEYAAAHPGIGKRPHAMGRLLLTMDRWPLAQTVGLRALASDPTFFETLLKVHVGAGSLPTFVAQRGLGVGWRLLTGRWAIDAGESTPAVVNADALRE